MGSKMATSQDFVNWICGPKLVPHFLKYLLVAEKAGYKKFSSGAVHQTIYYPEVKAFHVCMPPIPEQKRIVAILDEAFGSIDQAKANTERNLANARELFDSYLNRVFEEKGERWEESEIQDVISFIDYRGCPYGSVA
jgi:type I restriction enzyme S subunit